MKVDVVQKHTSESNNSEIKTESIVSNKASDLLNESIPLEYEEDIEFLHYDDAEYDVVSSINPIGQTYKGNPNSNENLFLENTDDTGVLNLSLLYRNYFRIEKIENGHIYAKCIFCERAGQNKNSLKATKKSSSNLMKHLKVIIEKSLT